MSEADNKDTAILLPASSVAVFSNDKATREAAEKVGEDWRFARVKLEVSEGDVGTATGYCKSNSSPDLVIIQTDSIEDSLPAQLEELAGNCEEDTAAIVIGPVNDVALYRKLIDMGVSDYLVVPIAAPDLADVIAKTLIERLGVSGSRLIAFIGAKGGVGTTALAQAAAWGVADILGQKTIIIDAAGGWSSAAVGLGFEPATTLAEAVRAAESGDEDALGRMLFAAGDRLSVLATGGDPLLDASVGGEQLEALVDTLMVKYPAVIADLSQAPPELKRAVLMRANRIVVVSTPTLPSLRLARSLIQEIKDEHEGGEGGIDIVINRQGAEVPGEVAKADIEQALEMKISALIPFTRDVFLKSENEGRKLTDVPEGRKIVKAHLLPLAQKVLAAEAPAEEEEETAKSGGGFLGGLLGPLKKKP